MAPRSSPLAPHWEYERLLLGDGHSPVAGVDVAGRGPLAGPVVAAAVILPTDLELPGLADSKVLTEAERETLYERIVAEALAIGVGEIPPERFDFVNIL